MRIYRCASCSAPYKGHVFMASKTFSVQFSENIRTARHKPCGFLTGPTSPPVLNVCGHEESAHVSLGCPNCRMFQDLVDALQVPGLRCPWVLVEKMPALFQLVPVQRATELDVFHGLGLLRLMLLEPTWFVLVCCFVEFLQQAEVGARGRPYQQVRRLLTDFRPSFPLVILQCKVPTVGYASVRRSMVVVHPTGMKPLGFSV